MLDVVEACGKVKQLSDFNISLALDTLMFLGNKWADVIPLFSSRWQFLV